MNWQSIIDWLLKRKQDIRPIESTATELGAVKDLADSRDYPFSDTRIAKTAKALILPERVDWGQYLPATKNQGNIGSCVACACASTREFLVKTLDPDSQKQYSPLHLYLRARQLAGFYPRDSGLYTRDALKILQDEGIADELAWPYVPERFNDTPPDYAIEGASWKRIYTYHRLQTNTITEMRQCLSERHVFVLSMAVFGSLVVLRLNNGGVVQLPGAGEPEAGGHAVLVFGYNDNSQMFHCLNSWGQGWGNRGKFWLPYEYVSRYAWDAWTVIS